ncbi:GDSL esterase/lipase At5g33370 [Cajanus cajan]|uniref:GDSL esterase/lipase At5g33370 family n=1 Tax=Cajanus cajan TaxID=3821 RepID=A0A151TQH2_CAJCA|nr:GDSL esterase/lipase At5g33370 [Cajanus cajan]KYP69271.1 GDSL esterase/lipase At5g33370 family [Cajanus cajan]
MAPSMILVLGLVLVVGVIVPISEARPRPFFVFGDSLVDNGNNNYLQTIARANVPPYGIDYPTHAPTGRFSNGFNIPDFISQQLGAESTMPYLSPELTRENLFVGANFASAGVGILNDTGDQFMNIIKMHRQIENFKEYQGRVGQLIGVSRTKRLVNEALILITVGGNDFVNNYFLVESTARSRQYQLPDYVNFLISRYRKHLQKLYNLGARRVIVTGTGPLGCAPAELARRGKNGECSAQLQRAATLYNPQLEQMILELNTKIGSDVFVAANTAQMHNDFIMNPQAYGFTTSKVACCGQGPYNGMGLCSPFSNLCSNRNLHVFWDPFHPSEKANKLVVEQIMSGSTRYMKPMNLSTILALDARSHS